jgi:glucosamine kinase
MSDPFYAGADGGGTKTTVALCDGGGRELARVEGPAGLVDPREPEASAQVVADLVRQAMGDAGLSHTPAALVAGLAGVGNPAERDAVRNALQAMDVAASVRIVTDGEIALEGALGGGPGVLLIAGTGSVAYGRGPDGRIERCGGWGMTVGDEGSGFAIGCAGLTAALYAHDGRGPRTALLDDLMHAIGVTDPRGIPPWALRAEKSEVAALARPVLDAAEGGDEVALGVIAVQARELARHVVALGTRLAPWPAPVHVVFHGGVLQSPLYARLVTEYLDADPQDFTVKPAVADAVAGALSMARGGVLASA